MDFKIRIIIDDREKKTNKKDISVAAIMLYSSQSHLAKVDYETSNHLIYVD